MDYCITPTNVQLPIEAYSYWPTADYIYFGQNDKIVRFIFYRIDFTPYELCQLTKFKCIINKRPAVPLSEFFTDIELIRILLGCKFNLKKALEALKNSIGWRAANLQNSYHSIYPKCSHLLVTPT